MLFIQTYPCLRLSTDKLELAERNLKLAEVQAQLDAARQEAALATARAEAVEKLSHFIQGQMSSAPLRIPTQSAPERVIIQQPKSAPDQVIIQQPNPAPSKHLRYTYPAAAADVDQYVAEASQSTEQMIDVRF